MSDLVGNHIVGFPTRRLIYLKPTVLSALPAVTFLGETEFLKG